MSKEKSICIGCVHAKWDTTAAGNLHPSGVGRCKWTPPTEPVIPRSMYYLSGRGKPLGGYINRNERRWEECPTFKRITP